MPERVYAMRIAATMRTDGLTEQTMAENVNMWLNNGGSSQPGLSPHALVWRTRGTGDSHGELRALTVLECGSIRS